jgi:octanoyl-[GcvH]:protein N-octanoyltransferase
MMHTLPLISYAHDADIYAPFAFEQQLAMYIGAGDVPSPVLVFWQHASALVLGMRDRRLPFAREAMARCQHEGIQTMVRSSGGAAVPLDEGVLNVTLIEASVVGQHLHSTAGFGRMVHLIQQALHRVGVFTAVGEVAGSYCPGTYDIHVHGKKVCGIAQHQLLRARIVQAFLNVHGDSIARASLVQRFYADAQGAALDAREPQIKINPAVIGTIEEARPCRTPLSIPHMIDALTVGTRPLVLPPWRDEPLHEKATLLRMRYDS